MYKLFNRPLPQGKGRITHLKIYNPRKPNSALRKAFKIIIKTKKTIIGKVCGSGKLPAKHAIVVFQGRGYRDTPNVNYTICRGRLECLPLFDKKRKRSLYAVPKNN